MPLVLKVSGSIQFRGERRRFHNASCSGVFHRTGTLTEGFAGRVTTVLEKKTKNNAVIVLYTQCYFHEIILIMWTKMQTSEYGIDPEDPFHQDLQCLPF